MEDMATCWKVDYFEGGNKDSMPQGAKTRHADAVKAAYGNIPGYFTRNLFSIWYNKPNTRTQTNSVPTNHIRPHL